MIGTGLFLTGIVEFVVLKGDISRMNTVFKFYLQVWVLWAVASAAALPRILQQLNRLGRPSRSPRQPFAHGRGVQFTLNPCRDLVFACRLPPSAGSGSLASCSWPVSSTRSRPRRSGLEIASQTAPHTRWMALPTCAHPPTSMTAVRSRLSGIARRPNGCGRISRALPTISRKPPLPSTAGARGISIYTGFPTVIGWDWHQKQQRSVIPGQLIDRRIENVRLLYNTTDLTEARRLLAQLGVDYIVVGQLERYYYDAGGLAKFEEPGGPWDIAYQNDQVKIYKVR